MSAQSGVPGGEETARLIAAPAAPGRATRPHNNPRACHGQWRAQRTEPMDWRDRVGHRWSLRGAEHTDEVARSIRTRARTAG